MRRNLLLAGPPLRSGRGCPLLRQAPPRLPRALASPHQHNRRNRARYQADQNRVIIMPRAVKRQPTLEHIIFNTKVIILNAKSMNLSLRTTNHPAPRGRPEGVPRQQNTNPEPDLFCYKINNFQIRTSGFLHRSSGFFNRKSGFFH